MLIPVTRPLFTWSELEDSPSLQTIRAVLASCPIRPLGGLQQARGQGRDNSPLRVLWGVTKLSGREAGDERGPLAQAVMNQAQRLWWEQAKSDQTASRDAGC